MASREDEEERREDLGLRPELALRGLLYVGYAFFLPWTYVNAGMSLAGLGLPGFQGAIASDIYYGFLVLSYFGAFCLLVILCFIPTLNRLVVSFMIVAPLGVIHLNRWYALQHFPEVWPM